MKMHGAMTLAEANAYARSHGLTLEQAITAYADARDE